MKMKIRFVNYMANTANGLVVAIFRKLTSEKTKDMGKTAERVFSGIGTGLLGCGEDGHRRHWKGSTQMRK